MSTITDLNEELATTIKKLNQAHGAAIQKLLVHASTVSSDPNSFRRKMRDAHNAADTATVTFNEIYRGLKKLCELVELNERA